MLKVLTLEELDAVVGGVTGQPMMSNDGGGGGSQRPPNLGDCYYTATPTLTAVITAPVINYNPLTGQTSAKDSSVKICEGTQQTCAQTVPVGCIQMQP